MRHTLFAVVLTASTALAQNCFDGNFGTQLTTPSTLSDWVSPIQPIGFAFPLGGATYTDIHVSDHGLAYLSNAGVPAPPVSSTAPLWTPSIANFISGSPKVCCLYADVILEGGGQIWINSSATQCVVTWRNMQNFGIPTPRFEMQMVLYPNGSVRFVYGANVTNNSTYGGVSDQGIVGLSPGGGTAPPTAVDFLAGGAALGTTIFENWATPMTFDLVGNTLPLTATNPGYTFAVLGAPANCATTTDYGQGCDGMTLTSVGLPTFGNSSYTLRVGGIPAISPVAFLAFGTSAVNPGAPLAIIGMPGCRGYTSFDIGLFASGPVAGGISNFPLSIPATPSVAGAFFTAQGIALSATILPANLAASNGTALTTGFGF